MRLGRPTTPRLAGALPLRARALHARFVETRNRARRAVGGRSLASRAWPDRDFIAEVTASFPHKHLADVEEARVLFSSLNYTMLDVRTVLENDEVGRVRGSVNIPRFNARRVWCERQQRKVVVAEPNQEFLGQVQRRFPDRAAPLLVVCANGSLCSPDAVQTLQQAGYTNVVRLEGGFYAWSQTWDNKLNRRRTAAAGFPPAETSAGPTSSRAAPPAPAAAAAAPEGSRDVSSELGAARAALERALESSSPEAAASYAARVSARPPPASPPPLRPSSRPPTSRRPPPAAPARAPDEPDSAAAQPSSRRLPAAPPLEPASRPAPAAAAPAQTPAEPPYAAAAAPPTAAQPVPEPAPVNAATSPQPSAAPPRPSSRPPGASRRQGAGRWRGMDADMDMSDDQQDISRGRSMVDSLFQGAGGMGGTHNAIMSSAEYLSSAARNLNNIEDGFYISPAFLDKISIHIAKNFLELPKIKVPLILGIWGGKGQGKTFQCNLAFKKLGISPIVMSAGELESGNAGEPAKLIRQRYREASDIIKKGRMCALFINDLDAGAGRMGDATQYTVNNQMVNATLMNIADNPTNVQLPGVYKNEEIPRVPIICTGNDFSTLYAPLIRDGRMEKFYWAPTREDRIGVCVGIFQHDNVDRADIEKLVDEFPGQSIDFFGALRARVYDDKVREWIAGLGVENIGKRLVNSREGRVEFEKPAMSLPTLMKYGNALVEEQENVKRISLAEEYLSGAALAGSTGSSLPEMYRVS